MTTEFKVGDVVRALNGYKGGRIKLPQQDEYTVVRIGVSGFTKNLFLGVDTDGETGWSPAHFELVRRASESQREGGFAVGQRVRTRPSWCGPANAGFEVEIVELRSGCAWTTSHPKIRDSTPCFLLEHLEPADPATAQPDCGCIEGHAHGCDMPTAPPQPAPMTRAARVLSGMMADPYAEALYVDCYSRATNDAHPRNEAARLRMARMSLDRPLDAEQARWERLVCAVHPVTGRAVRR